MLNHIKSSRWLLLISLVVVLLFHTLLTFYFTPPSLVFSQAPLRGEDFDGHFGQVTRFIDAFSGWGKSWSYDHHLLAGHPAGTIGDANTKAWELWTWLLWKAGLARGLAFNLFVLLSFLLIPWVMFLAARLFKLGPWAATVVALFAGILWFFDSQTHNFWWIGMTAWTFASYFCVLPLGFFYRYMSNPSAYYAAATALALGLCILIHPYSFVPLSLPMFYLYFSGFRRMHRTAHLQVAAIALFTVALNSWWIFVALRFWHYVLDSAYFSQTRLSTLLFDFLELVENPGDTAHFMRSGFRFLTLSAAVAGLIQWRRERDDRFAVFAVALAWLIFIAYVGSYFWIFAQVQPYRYVVPAVFLALIPGIAFFSTLSQTALVRDFTWPCWALLAICSIPGLQLLARDVIFYFPDLAPSHYTIQNAKDQDFSPASLSQFADLRLQRQPDGDQLIPRWLASHLGYYKRVFVESPRLGEWLAHRVDGIEVLGGFLQRNIQHTDANLFHRYPGRTATAEQLKSYLETYAVQWVILSPEMPFPVKYRDLLRVRAKLPGGIICETTTKVSYFEQGDGRLSASTNRIEARGTDPLKTLVIRYHWMETLACKPNCRVQREYVPNDAVGFIRVPAPHPENFIIYNSYIFH
ncbi:MAG: hypothetical protein JXA30_13160 [Deltaproteobacteria bacterium]|nr:hypothetical protein [Deltaproteobacteria bacterium]